MVAAATFINKPTDFSCRRCFAARLHSVVRATRIRRAYGGPSTVRMIATKELTYFFIFHELNFFRGRC